MTDPIVDWTLAGAQAFERLHHDQRSAAARDFAHWVAAHRAYNGSEHEHGQSLYNEFINTVLPTWADEWAAEQAANAERPTDFNRYCAECRRWTDHEGPHHPFTAGASDETVLAVAREASDRWRGTLGLLAAAELAERDDGNRLRDEEAEQILRAADDPNLPDDVFDVIEQILAAHVRSAESSRERAMHSRAEWRRRAKVAEQQRDLATATAADAVAKLDRLHNLLAEPAESRAALLAQRMIRDALAAER